MARRSRAWAVRTSGRRRSRFFIAASSAWAVLALFCRSVGLRLPFPAWQQGGVLLVRHRKHEIKRVCIVTRRSLASNTRHLATIAEEGSLQGVRGRRSAVAVRNRQWRLTSWGAQHLTITFLSPPCKQVPS